MCSWKLRSRLWFLPLAFCIGGLAAAAANARTPGVASSFTLRDMTYVASAEHGNELVLDAEWARLVPAERVAHLQNIRARLASAAPANGPGALDLRCDRGSFVLDSGDFEAEGHVRGVTGDGRRFRTSKLRYRRKPGLVSSDAPVVIQDETGTYRGGGFRYWVHENRFQLLGGADVHPQP